MSAELVLTADNFQKEVLDASLPVLVDFWAEWCMPCKMIAPSLEQVAEKYKGQAIIGTVDVDAQGDLAQRYNIISIPTLIVFKGGKVHTQKVGALPKHEIENLVKGAL